MTKVSYSKDVDALLIELGERAFAKHDLGAIAYAEDKENVIGHYSADFRQAWHEAMTGQTIPVAQLWEGLGDRLTYNVRKVAH